MVIIAIIRYKYKFQSSRGSLNVVIDSLFEYCTYKWQSLGLLVVVHKHRNRIHSPINNNMQSLVLFFQRHATEVVVIFCSEFSHCHYFIDSRDDHDDDDDVDENNYNYIHGLFHRE